MRPDTCTWLSRRRTHQWSNAPHDYILRDAEREDEALIVVPQRTCARLGDNGIQRYKGLGEMDYTEPGDTTMDPARRTLLQVKMEDEGADQVFSRSDKKM